MFILYSSVDSEGGKTPKSIDSALQNEKKWVARMQFWFTLDESHYAWNDD